MPDEAPPKILVIDDELGPRESLRFLLKPEFRVFCAEGVDRGLELLREHAPDAVILDIRMPGRSGIEGLREIRQIDPDTAVIMLTGYGALDTAQEAVRNDANDYLEKPFDASEMRRTVRWHVSRTQMRRKRVHLENEMEKVRCRLAAELHRKDLMAELGQASAEFVHDLRNALSGACGSVDMLRLQLGGALPPDPAGPPPLAAPPPLVDEYLAMMERTILQCSDLLDAWGRLIQQQPSHARELHLATIAQDAVAACQSAAHAAQARLACDLGTDDPRVLGDPTQLGRALTNLIRNAIQALPPSAGWVQVSVRRAADRALVRVADNGRGIAPEHLERIFEPRFTTRPTSGGMGLGLFIALKVVEAHHGTLSVESTAGQGTTMLISLPIHPAPASG